MRTRETPFSHSTERARRPCARPVRGTAAQPSSRREWLEPSVRIRRLPRTGDTKLLCDSSGTPADNLRTVGPYDADIREAVREHGRIALEVATLSRDADLYDAGLTSHASVGVMLALEDRFGIVFPEYLLTRSVFSSIAAISDALDEVLARGAA